MIYGYEEPYQFRRVVTLQQVVTAQKSKFMYGTHGWHPWTASAEGSYGRHAWMAFMDGICGAHLWSTNCRKLTNIGAKATLIEIV